MPRIPLHWKIIIGLLAGALFGLLAVTMGWNDFTSDWIKPFGTIFINLLKLIAVPLVIVSLITGVSSLKDISSISRIGGRTILIYLFTTIIAIVIGLLLVNIIRPGHSFSPEKREQLQNMYSSKTSEKLSTAEEVKRQGPLQFLVDIVPDNIFKSMTDNTRMLQVIFFALLFGICMALLPNETMQPVRILIQGINDIILKMVTMIMLAAPYGVFALIASIISDFAKDNLSHIAELFQALGMYSLTVLLGLALMLFAVYPLLLRLFTSIPYKRFLSGIFPAQMIAFSTSSSAAALPVNLECCEENLKLRKEVTRFVLPLGATINMDGTSLYQAVAAVFIAQAFGYDLSLSQQLTIVLTAVLASIGAAPVPGAGMVMLVIILQSIGIQPEGLALIFAVDRILDMCRTVVNITSDAAVAAVVSGKMK